ncbi:MAG: hypothetical protein WAT58_03180 [Candidatus Dormiibacterota bacterium]
MPAFLKVRRNQLIIGGVLVLLLVLLGLFLFLPRNQTTSNTTASGSATVSPSPSPDISPSPSSARVPSPGAPTIGPQGAVLRTGTAPDDGSAVNWGANGGAPGCGPSGLNWHHTGWIGDECTIVVLGGTTEQSMAWVIEHKISDNSKRISILKGTTGNWVTALYAIGDSGSFTAITAKSADITGDGRPEILVGFRMVGTNHVLNLDGVRRTSTSDPLVIIHRELVNGKATSSGGLTDYSAAGGGYTKTVITYGGSSFHGTSSTVASAPPGDFG